MDLVSLNLQRGRDHGLPSYVEYRRLCGLADISDWRGLANNVQNAELVPRLQRLYRNIEDIDLFLGGMMERPARGALLGPTFQCIVADQFKRLKFADRFWYEESGHDGAFSEGSILKITLFMSLCSGNSTLLFAHRSSGGDSREQSRENNLRQRRQHSTRAAFGVQAGRRNVSSFGRNNRE